MGKVFGPAINIDGVVEFGKYQTEEQLTQQMQIVRDGGFSYVDMGYGEVMYHYTEEMDRNFVAALQNCGIMGIQSHAPIVGKVVCEADRLCLQLTAEEETALENLFRVAGHRGTKLVIFHPHTLYPDLWGDEWLPEHLRVNLEFFEWMGQLAKPYGIRIAVETMANLGEYRHYCSRPEELEELVDVLREKEPEIFGICVDTGHVHFEGYAPHEVIRRFGKKVIALHIQDNNGFTDQHNLPPFGTIDWNAFCDAIREVGFEGPLTFECMGGHLKGRSPEWQKAFFAYAKVTGDALLEQINK